MKNIQAVIFDADGVVNDGKLLDITEHGISTESIQPFFKGPFHSHVLVGKADLKEALAPYLKEWGWKGTVEDFLGYWFTSGHIINPVVVDTIRKLRTLAIPTYLATNQEKHRIHYMKEKMGYQELFDEMFSSGHLGHAKPSDAFFEAMHRSIPIQDRSSVLFWDDTFKNVEAASKFGYTAHHFTSNDDFQAKMKEYFPSL